MILGIPVHHLEETCRLARQCYSRNGTAQEASVDGQGAMVSHGYTFADCRPASLQSSRQRKRSSDYFNTNVKIFSYITKENFYWRGIKEPLHVYNLSRRHPGAPASRLMPRST